MATRKKMVFRGNIQDKKSKKRLMKRNAGIAGVESVAVDMKEEKIPVLGRVKASLLASLTAELRKFGTSELLSIGPAKTQECEAKKAKKEGPAKPEKFEAKKAEKKEWSNWDTENRGANHYLGVRRADAVGGFGGMNPAIEDIVEAVARFGDFSSIQVDIKKGMVTVVGKSVPVRVALKVREMGYRAKLLSLGPATEEEDPDEEDSEDLDPNRRGLSLYRRDG